LNTSFSSFYLTLLEVSVLLNHISVEACKKGIETRFFRTAALVNRLSEAKKNGTLSVFMKKISKAELLICDEWGYVPLDRTGAQLLFEVISECYERNTLIICLAATEGSSFSATSFSVQSRTESHFNPFAVAYCRVLMTVLRAQPQASAIRVLLIPRLCNRRISL
jgi:hypothetical protein